MTEQSVSPPARVWERIEKILDEQDVARKRSRQTDSFTFSKNFGGFKGRKSIYLAAAGFSLLAGFIWKIV